MNIDEIKLQLPEDIRLPKFRALADLLGNWIRSEEHTSELQSQ